MTRLRLGGLLLAALPLVATPALAQKQTPPPAGTPKDFKLPARHEFTLPNGMKVTLVPFGTVPKVNVSLVVRAGRINQGPNQVWLADLTADLMNEGTTTHTASQVAELAASMGGEVSARAASDQTTIDGSGLNERAADLVRLVAEVGTHPRLPASELARLKADRLRTLSITRSQPQPLADEKFRQIMYPNHPYGRVFPTETMLKGYTIAQVRSFYTANFGAARAHLYVVGVFDAAAVERAARAAFAGWARGAAPVVNVPKPVNRRVVELLDRPNAVQSTVIVGLSVPDPTSPDYTALDVTDALLGGAFGSRITANIREAKGYTYSPYSTVTTRYHTSTWAEEADVTTAVTGPSLTEIFNEINRLRGEAPPTEELAGIERNLAGIFTLQNSSRGGITGQLQFVDQQGLGDDYLTGYVRRVLAVTPADVQRIAQRYLVPEKMAIVVVGDSKTVAPQIAPFRATVP
jgi:zinc protease